MYRKFPGGHVITATGSNLDEPDLGFGSDFYKKIFKKPEKLDWVTLKP